MPLTFLNTPDIEKRKPKDWLAEREDIYGHLDADHEHQSSQKDGGEDSQQ
jgi:hypothetical protein